MISKTITLFYLISLLSTLWIVYRHKLGLDNELMLSKVLIVLCSGYFVSVSFIFIYVLNFKNLFLFFCMIALCPFMQILIYILKKYEYKGDISVFVLSIMLNSIGLVILYRLDVSSGWFLTKDLGYEESIPLALKQLIFSMVAMLGVVICLVKGYFTKSIVFIEKNKNIMIWGIASFAILSLPKLIGGSIWLTQDRSIQPSEFAFKISFIIFIAKYYESKSSELILRSYPLKEILKLVIFVFTGVVIFFFFPLVFLQKELGTALLIGLTFIILTAYVTNRFSFFLIGLALIALAIYAGTHLNVHVEKRVIAAWIDWKEYAFKPFGDGKLYPGYQIFTALAAIRLSPWGVGIGNGILKHMNMDRTIVPMAVNDFAAIPVAYEMGILAIAIIVMGYIVMLDKAIQKYRSLNFRNILAAGIVIALITQGLYNLSSVFALLPATGIPLPWVSYGGSAAFANYTLVGLLMTILSGKGDSGHEK